MSKTADRSTGSVYLSRTELQRAMALAPVANSGAHAGKPSLTMMMREVIDIGELARPLVHPDELPWDAVRAAVRSAVTKALRKAKSS
jgi:hypothetical protein